MTLDQIIDATVKLEGGYINDPTDKGGETNYGITVATARAAGYTGAMKDLPLTTAKQIYRNEYIVKPGFDSFVTLSSELTAKLFDIGVNMGPANATKFLQDSLNLLFGSTLTVDGKMGPATRTAVTGYFASRTTAASILIKMINCLQGARYADIVRKDPTQRKYINGWIGNRIS